MESIVLSWPSKSCLTGHGLTPCTAWWHLGDDSSHTWPSYEDCISDDVTASIVCEYALSRADKNEIAQQQTSRRMVSSELWKKVDWLLLEGEENILNPLSSTVSANSQLPHFWALNVSREKWSSLVSLPLKCWQLIDLVEGFCPR